MQTRPAQSLSGGFGSEFPQSDGVPPVAFTSGTLDETVGETLWRDASHVGGKLLLVLMPYTSGSETIEHLRDWDLWGPLVVSLTIATSLATGSSYANAAVVFFTCVRRALGRRYSSQRERPVVGREAVLTTDRVCIRLQ